MPQPRRIGRPDVHHRMMHMRRARRPNLRHLHPFILGKMCGHYLVRIFHFAIRRESAPPSAFSPPNPAAEYSSLHSKSAEQAHQARFRQALQHLPTPRCSQSAPHSTTDHWQNVRTADRQTMAASSASARQPQFSRPMAVSAHRSPAPSAQLPHCGGNSGICPGVSEAHPYKK